MDLSRFQMLTFILHKSIVTSFYGWGFWGKLNNLPKVTKVLNGRSLEPNPASGSGATPNHQSLEYNHSTLVNNYIENNKPETHITVFSNPQTPTPLAKYINLGGLFKRVRPPNRSHNGYLGHRRSPVGKLIHSLARFLSEQWQWAGMAAPSMPWSATKLSGLCKQGNTRLY